MCSERRKIYISTVISIIFLIVFLLGLPWAICSLVKVHEKHNVLLPNQGIWHCEELNMTLDFEHSIGNVKYQGSLVRCEIGQERGDTNNLFVIIQQERASKLIFYGHCSEAYEDEVCIIDDEVGIPYWFRKIDS